MGDNQGVKVLKLNKFYASGIETKQRYTIMRLFAVGQQELTVTTQIVA